MGVGWGGQVARLAGLGRGGLLQGGISVGPKGPLGELVGPCLSPDVTGDVVPTGFGGCPHELLIRWQLSRRGRGGWSEAPGFPSGFQRVGW